jgi:hypothetical protein
MISFKNRTIGFYAGFASGALAVITSIVYLIQSAVVHQFDVWVFLCLLVGGGLLLVTLLKDYDFIPLVAGTFLGFALGLFVRDRAEWFTYVTIDPDIAYNMLGDRSVVGVVVFVFVLTIVSVIGACVSCFGKQRKGELK